MQLILTDEQVGEVAQLTSLNCHVEACQLGAELLGLDKLADRCKRILSQQLALGHLPDWLYAEKRGAYDELMDFARSNMSAADFQKLYMAF